MPRKNNLLVPSLIVGLLVLAFISGSLWQKVKSLEKGGAVAGTGTTGIPQQGNQAPADNYLSLENLKKYAKELKLDTNKFNNCIDKSEKKAAVDAQLSEGTAEGIQGTPGFFLNGYQIAGAIPFEMFKQLIDFELSTGLASGKYTPEVQKLIDQKIILTEKKQPKSEGYPAKGPADAKITLVEYSDFECPYCVRAYPTIQKVVETYPSDVRIVYKQFPLINIHPNAQRSAEASLCALDQGKFWEYHDKLFSREI